jgi:hypothetical protein
MANLKSITELPVAESAEGLNLIVNDNGSAKQIAASAVGAQADFAVTDENSPAFIKNKPEVVQADWAETDENSPAYVKNKPVEEYDFDIEFTMSWNTENSNYDLTHTVNHVSTFEDIKNKILNGDVVKKKFMINMDKENLVGTYASIYIDNVDISLMPAEGMGDGSPEMIFVLIISSYFGFGIMLGLDTNNSIMAVLD